MKIPRMFVDLDQVLVDFVGGACELHGTTRELLEQKRNPGHYDMADVLGITHDEFWKPINEAGEEFWFNLKPFPWAEDVIRFATNNSHEWHIASAPNRSPASYTGKVKWLKRQFGERFDNFLLTPHKYLFANAQSLLLDDREENIDKFIYAGGRGLIFPTTGNRLYQYAADPVSYLNKMWRINNGSL